MSTATIPTTFGDFDDDAFQQITARFDDEPAVPQRPRWVSKREAIDEGLGFRRSRTRERVL